MTYYCLCMSPAIDANVKLATAPRGDGEIFKNVIVEENPGGKTINVARYLALRGAGAVHCLGLLGEDNAALFEREFSSFSIIDKMTRVRGATRRNEMITWPGGAFKLNQPAFPGLDFDEDAFLDRLLSDVAENDEITVIISGSLPGCCSALFYAKAVAAFKRRGAFVVLDASGEAMVRALEEKPDLIKPNAEECEALVGFVPKTPDEFKKATALLKTKAEHVIISDGASGAWFDVEFFAAPKVNAVDTTAAGDTLLAEYCYSRNPALAVAAGSAAVEKPGSNAPEICRVKELAAYETF